MDGFLAVNKPVGISSFGVVARVRRLASEAVAQRVKVGHTGTLDPAANGLLILVFGSYCKRAREFSKLDKTYAVEATLGSISSTGDEEGQVELISAKVPTETEIRQAIAKFSGLISQTPPIYSAVKIGGQRAYKLARAGKEVKLEPRQVVIHSIKDVAYNYPKLSFLTEVSSGTYIRSLVEDIGREIGVGAYMNGLTRTKIADYQLADASALASLSPETVQSRLQRLPNHL